MGDAIRLCSGAEAIKKFQRAGWRVDRRKGSHVMPVKQGYDYTLSIPQHATLGIGILRKLIRQASISVEEFNNL